MCVEPTKNPADPAAGRAPHLLRRGHPRPRHGRQRARGERRGRRGDVGRGEERTRRRSAGPNVEGHQRVFDARRARGGQKTAQRPSPLSLGFRPCSGVLAAARPRSPGPPLCFPFKRAKSVKDYSSRRFRSLRWAPSLSSHSAPPPRCCFFFSFPLSVPFSSSLLQTTKNTTTQVRLKDHGTELIEVADNGSGVRRSDRPGPGPKAPHLEAALVRRPRQGALVVRVPRRGAVVALRRRGRGGHRHAVR